MSESLEAIRARHAPTVQYPRLGLPTPTGACAGCGKDWPCDTAQVLARLDAAEARKREGGS
jgi:hypothetical protein